MTTTDSTASVKYIDLKPWPCYFGLVFDEDAYHKEIARLGAAPEDFCRHAAHTIVFTKPGNVIILIAYRRNPKFSKRGCGGAFCA